MSDGLDAMVGLIPTVVAAGVVMKVTDRMLPSGPIARRSNRRSSMPNLFGGSKMSQKQVRDRMNIANLSGRLQTLGHKTQQIGYSQGRALKKGGPSIKGTPAYNLGKRVLSQSGRHAGSLKGRFSRPY